MNRESAKLLWCAIQIGDIQNFSIETTDNIDSLRKFHNFIKTQIIDNAVKETNGKTLLDIAVGRGGDLFKWQKSKLKTVVGFDPHKDSITEARKRLSEQLKKGTRLPFTKFFQLDALDRNIISKLIDNEKNIKNVEQYDIISCQFAFHYFTNSQSDMNNVLRLISYKLRPGGFFIGTASDGDIIKNILTKGDVMTKLLQLKRVDKTKYTFNIASNSGTQTYFDVQGISLESFLHKNKLIETAKDYGLEVVNIKSFFNWYMEYNGTITLQEALISFLNFSFIFQKIDQV